MITAKMVLEAKKRLKMLMEKPMYRDHVNCFSDKVRKNTKAALLAKLLNDMEGEDKRMDIFDELAYVIVNLTEEERDVLVGVMANCGVSSKNAERIATEIAKITTEE